METHGERHHLDVDFEVARSIHRVVRAMHDGECPSCHVIMSAERMRSIGARLPAGAMGFCAKTPSQDMTCPECGFTITHAEQLAAFQAFAPVMERNLAVFEEWREQLNLTPAEEPAHV